MVSLFALYRRPADEAAFLDYYRNHHVPLARTMPGLLSLEWGHPSALAPGESAEWYIVAEMRFANRAAMDAALASSEGRAALRDVQQFAGNLVTMRVVNWE
ncbi:EthD family reductase [Sulfobacillus harzensis]|uniref:EthD family reductase n=1 Tax=Sulfobacillus harzensis TaxID=2729629 RepID=A0A7Y0L191_9FIRM|nr:EthD family reductase [Sulfobacillus harzensis]NMP21193.1 EthD family reductase [Sulfobacillus harzensis]